MSAERLDFLQQKFSGRSKRHYWLGYYQEPERNFRVTLVVGWAGDRTGSSSVYTGIGSKQKKIFFGVGVEGQAHNDI